MSKEFQAKLETYRLKNFPADKSREELADAMLALRFPFTRESVGDEFINTVRKTLASLPVVLLQIMAHKKIYVELDMVSEIAAVLEMEKHRLWVSRYFMIDKTLYETLDNPFFPYGLKGTLLHELGHLLDWGLNRPNRLSGLATFQAAFADDIRQIPPDMRITHEQRVALHEKHGGYMNLPPDDRLRCDLALFCLQEEETFCDAFAYLMTGRARPVVESHFPGTIEATAHLLGYYLAQVSVPGNEG